MKLVENMSEKTHKEYTDWLQHVLGLKGWTASGWARRAELSTTTITRMLKGHRGTPEFTTVMALAKAAGVTPPLSLIGHAPSTRTKIVDLDSRLSGAEVVHMLLAQSGGDEQGLNRLIKVTGQRNAEHIGEGDIVEITLITERLPKEGDLIAVWCTGAVHVGRLIDGRCHIGDGPPLAGPVTFLGRVVAATRLFV